MFEQEEATGALCVTVGVMFSVLANTLVKLLQDVPVLQLLQARFTLQCWVSLCLAVAMKLLGFQFNLLGEGVRHLLLLRALCFSVTMGSLWSAMRVMPIGETTAIFYLYPVVCGLLAKWLLQEKLGLQFQLQASLSVLGVILVVYPFGDSSDSYHNMNAKGIGLAFMACVGSAMGAIVMRMLKDTKSIVTQVYTDVVAAAVLLPLAQFLTGTHDDGWGVWDRHHVILLLGFTACGLTASLFIICGFTMASANKAALSCYAEVPAALLMQVFFFNQPLGIVRITGVLLITGSAALRVTLENIQASDQPTAAKKLLDEASQQYSTFTETASESDLDSNCDFGRMLSPAAYGSLGLPIGVLQDRFQRSETEPSCAREEAPPMRASRTMTMA